MPLTLGSYVKVVKMPIIGLIIGSIVIVAIVLLLVGLLFYPDYTKKKNLAGYALIIIVT